MPTRSVLLCINDRPQLLQIRQVKLEGLGYSVLTARDAVSAISILKKTRFAAVLLEYNSEGLDAEAVAFQIRQRYPDQPIILLSAYSEMPERLLWLVDEYVMRSEPLERVNKAIERATAVIRKPPAQSENLRMQRKAAG